MSTRTAGPAMLPPIDPSLMELAPEGLSNHRELRYLGDDLHACLDELAAADQNCARNLYQSLSELLFHIADTFTDDVQKWLQIEEWLQRHRLDALIDDVRGFGQASQGRNPDDTLAKTVHDVRGGALTPLLGRLQLLDRLPRTGQHLNILFVLARDHLKIMRNALVGLDEARRNADRTPKAHDIRLMLDKWHQSVVGPPLEEHPVQMFMDCRYEGPLTECCLESAAIDRIFYNLAANACRHTADARLEMVVFPVSGAGNVATCLRFVLSNAITDADAAHLDRLGGNGDRDGAHGDSATNLEPLFEARVSSTGSGMGLAVIADFVAGAFGLSDAREAVRQRYVGAIIDGHTFRTWFHWPVARRDLPPKLDDYQQPEQSLSEPR